VSRRAAHHNRLLGRAAARLPGSRFRTPPPQVGASRRALRRRAHSTAGRDGGAVSGRRRPRRAPADYGSTVRRRDYGSDRPATHRHAPESKERDRGRLARAVADWIACSGDVCFVEISPVWVSEGGLHQIVHGCSRRSSRWSRAVSDERGRSAHQVVQRRWLCSGSQRSRPLSRSSARVLWCGRTEPYALVRLGSEGGGHCSDLGDVDRPGLADGPDWA
jgi:hypothetical protein